jgi:hypothetical protein
MGVIGGAGLAVGAVGYLIYNLIWCCLNIIMLKNVIK